ncbi:AI-2E family transporter [Alkaliphilus serpentinus]|uniref:AI-2E family transporter n=1 Tax=Alkaliphilus serpentinus TaxID=1482731 RepID=UPI001FAB0D5A|nr:AI-2E family transporter [Alkaliphilus serpentinus]
MANTTTNTAIDAISRSVKNLAEQGYLTGFIVFFIYLFLLLLLGFTIYYLIHIGNRFVDNNKRITINRSKVFNYVLLLIGIFLLLIMVQFRQLLISLLSPFIVALVLAYTLNPLVRMLHKKGIGRLWGVLIIYLAFSVLIFIFSITIVPKITEEVKKLIELMPRYSNDAYNYLYQLFVKYNQNIENLPKEFSGVKDLLNINITKVQQVVVSVLTSVTNTILSMFSKIVSLILIPILGFYFLKDAEEFKKSATLLIPGRYRRGVLEVFKDIDVVLGGFIRGQITVAAIVGVASAIALSILGIEFAVLVGIIAGVANIIPYFGPVIGLIPGVLFALMDGPIKAVWVVVIFVIIQQVESGIISPKIVGKSVGIHPIWVMLSLLIGGQLFGLVGLLLAVPSAGVIKVLGKHFIKHITKVRV